MNISRRTAAVLMVFAALTTAGSTTAQATPDRVPPEPLNTCPIQYEIYRAALSDIHAAQRRASTTAMRRTLHLELVQLSRDLSLESSAC